MRFRSWLLSSAKEGLWVYLFYLLHSICFSWKCFCCSIDITKAELYKSYVYRHFLIRFFNPSFIKTKIRFHLELFASQNKDTRATWAIITICRAYKWMKSWVKQQESSVLALCLGKRRANSSKKFRAIIVLSSK